MQAVLSLFRRKPAEEDADSVLLAISSDLSSTRLTLADLQAAKAASTRHVTLTLLAIWVAYVAVFLTARQAGVSLVTQNMWLALPVIFGLGPVVGARSAVNWFYTRQIKYNETKLQDLILRRNKTLDNVKESKSYNDAQRLLALYGGGAPSVPANQPNHKSKLAQDTPTSTSTPKSSRLSAISTTPASMRPGGNDSSVSDGTPSRLSRRGKSSLQNEDVANSPSTRHWADRLTNVLLGPDSPAPSLPPSESFALICSKCAEHNGLVEADRRRMRWSCRSCGTINGGTPSSLSPTFPSAVKALPPARTQEKLMQTSTVPKIPKDEDEIMSED